MKVCIVGGGNLGHAYSGIMPVNIDVVVLTRRPNDWSNTICILDENKQIVQTHKIHATSDSSELTNADVIIITLPCTARLTTLTNIAQYISPKSLLICAPTTGGTNFLFNKLFPNNPYACLQRVPYICRTINYGNSVFASPKQSLEVFFSKNCSKHHYDLFNQIHNIPFTKLQSYWPLILSNSNPIIHIARICEIIQNNYPSNKQYLFYEQWGDTASQIALAMDNELKQVMQALNVSEYRDLLTHYQVADQTELTNKIQSIPSFRGIVAPMININGKYHIDSNSRYIQEDLPYGTCFIKYIAQHLGIKTPNIDKAIVQIQPILGRTLLQNNTLNTELFIQYLGYDIKNYIDI